MKRVVSYPDKRVSYTHFPPHDVGHFHSIAETRILLGHVLVC